MQPVPFPNTGKLQCGPLQQARGVELDQNLPAAMICNTLEARVCFARQGIGIVYLPDFAIHEGPDSGQ